jgi:hypothetical protein
MRIRRSIRRIVRGARGYEFIWRYVYNLGPTLSYTLSRPRLSTEAKRVLCELNQDGVAITSAARLLGLNSCYEELSAAVVKAECNLSAEIESARVASTVDRKVGSKKFIVPLLGDAPLLDLTSVYARFALQREVLDVANAYLGMYGRLRYFNVWHTLASNGGPQESQLWHRDREDLLILKAFVYLTDVNSASGPFTYAPGTHLRGRVRKEPRFFLEGGVRRSDDSQMADAVRPKDWVEGTGPKGTIIFADTAGFHKGGFATANDRLMYTCMFTSPASDSKEFFQRTELAHRRTNAALAYALAPPQRGPWIRVKSHQP